MGDFPHNPNRGERYSVGGTTYIWNGFGWAIVPHEASPPPPLPPPIDTSNFLSVKGGKVLGYLELAKEAPIIRSHVSNKGYVDDMAGANIQRINAKVSRSGDVMRGSLTLWGDPVIDMHAVHKKYVDQEIKKLLARIATLEFKLGQQ